MQARRKRYEVAFATQDLQPCAHFGWAKNLVVYEIFAGVIACRAIQFDGDLQEARQPSSPKLNAIHDCAILYVAAIGGPPPHGCGKEIHPSRWPTGKHTMSCTPTGLLTAAAPGCARHCSRARNAFELRRREQVMGNAESATARQRADPRLALVRDCQQWRCAGCACCLMVKRPAAAAVRSRQGKRRQIRCSAIPIPRPFWTLVYYNAVLS